MWRKGWRGVVAPLTALVLAGVSAATAPAAQAAPAAPDASAMPVSRSGSLTVRQASTEQVLAMAADGKGRLVTLGAKEAAGAKAADDVSIQVTCYLNISLPYGGGAWDADILVDGYVICDDYIHVGVLTVELFRGASRVANTTATYPYVYGIYATAGVSTCNEGVYFGVVGATVARYDLTPPSVTASFAGYPLYMGCASPPDPPQPPAPFAVTNPGNQSTFVYDSDTLQMTATGGTAPYTWSASGLPPGFSINSGTGLISGASRSIGSTTVTVTAVDAAGRSASTQFSWSIRREACPTC